MPVQAAENLGDCRGVGAVELDEQSPANATCFTINNLSFDRVPDLVTVTNPGPQGSFAEFHAALQITAASSLKVPAHYRPPACRQA